VCTTAAASGTGSVTATTLAVSLTALLLALELCLTARGGGEEERFPSSSLVDALASSLRAEGGRGLGNV
jgi:hypothetical protein